MCLVIVANALFQVGVAEVLAPDSQSAFLKAIFLFDPFQVR